MPAKDEWPKHPVEDLIKALLPDIKIKISFRPGYVLVEDLIVSEPNGTLLSTGRLVCRILKQVCDETGIEMRGSPRAVEGYDTSAERLVRLYTRAGAYFDEDLGMMRYNHDKEQTKRNVARDAGKFHDGTDNLRSEVAGRDYC